jgi:hypothetical protein
VEQISLARPQAETQEDPAMTGTWYVNLSKDGRLGWQIGPFDTEVDAIPRADILRRMFPPRLNDRLGGSFEVTVTLELPAESG